MAKKKNKNKKEVEKEVVTHPELAKIVNSLYSLAEHIIGKNNIYNIVETDIMKASPSKRSNMLYEFITKEIYQYMCELEAGVTSYIISGETMTIPVDEKDIGADDLYVEPLQISNYIYSGFYANRSVDDKLHQNMKNMYGNKDIRDVLKYLTMSSYLMRTLSDHKFKLSKLHSVQVAKSLVVYMNLLKAYMAFFTAHQLTTCLTQKELFLDTYKISSFKPVVSSKFVIKMKETEMNRVIIDYDNTEFDFISFRLFEKVFETFDINQFDIDTSEICTNISSMIYYRVTIIKDISLTYGSLNIYSELASLGVGMYDEWWDVKTPVAVITFENSVILLTKGKNGLMTKFIKIQSKFGEIEGYSESQESVTKLATKSFEYLLNRFNDKIHEFFRLNDKGIGTFDVEVENNDNSESKGHRHFTPKKTVVKGHVRHYKSGVISYVLPHVRCYEGGEDSTVILNLK